MPTFQQISAELRQRYPWKKYDFNTNGHNNLWKYRYLIAAIVCSGNSEKNTLQWMETEQPIPKKIANENWKPLADRMESFGLKYSGKKAKEIIEVSKYVNQAGVPAIREMLEMLPGVGRHVASVILATVFNQPEFGIDFHVKRVLYRMGYDKMPDKKLESLIHEFIHEDHIGHFSRAFVDFGQNICTTNPNCSSCPFNLNCRKIDVVQTKQIVSSFKDGPYSSICGKYTITVNNGVLKCNCIAGKFNKPCRHKSEFLA